MVLAMLKEPSFSAVAPFRASRWRRFAVAGLVAAVLAPLVSMPASALDGDDGAHYWVQERLRADAARRRLEGPIVQRPTRLIRRAAPVLGYARPAGPNEVPPVDPNAPQEARPADASAPPTAINPPATEPNPAAQAPALPQATFTVLVMGDSMGQMLGQGLTEAFGESRNVVVLQRAKENTGLVRDDYYDWVKGARDLANGPDRIDFAVMMIGSNDNQVLRDGNVVAEPQSPRWKQIYTQRVEAIDQAFRDRKIPLVWLSAPIVKSDRLSATLLRANEIYREAANTNHATYVDIWEPFADDRGMFASYGPDLGGQITKLRSADGVHFTKAGARKLAHFAEIEIRRALDQARPVIDPTIANLAPQVSPADPSLSQPVNQPKIDVPSSQPARAPDDLQALLPAPAAALQPVIPIKPAAGAVLPLTTPVISPGGQLATPSRTALRRPAAPASLVEQVLVEGRPVEPRAGRADDFRWPRTP